MTPILIDTSAFVTAKDSYYGFDICPGFWACVRDGIADGSLLGITHVWDEIEQKDDELTAWMKSHFRRSQFFDCSGDSRVFQAMSVSVSQHLDGQLRKGLYRQAAHDAFLNPMSADPWLLAYCLAYGGSIATVETSGRGEYYSTGHVPAEGWRRVSLLDMCIDLGIRYLRPWELLRAQKASLNLQPESH